MVIQRWQSVLLFLAAALMACFTFLSLGQVQTADYSFDITTLGFTYEGIATEGAPTGYLVRTWYFFTLSLLSVILPLIAIFMYRNLRQQRNICMVEIMFILATCATGGVLGYCLIEDGTVGWSSIIIAPLLALICTIMAANLIKRDKRRLESVNRFR